MATAQINRVIQHLRRVVLSQDGAGRTDGQLLESFVRQKDEAAFEALVRRHGPMVLGVCRRILRNHHDAEDAFQATFLVLAQKASSVRPRERVANWLHGVASRTSLKARAMATKRQVREKQVMKIPEPEVAPQDHCQDLQPLLDQELSGLPETYRLAILLCDLEGKSIKEATRQLGWPQGTVAGRLARGRTMLAKRLARRGLVLSAGPLAVLSPNGVSAGVATSLVSSTVKAASLVMAGQMAVTGVVPAKVAALMQGVMKAMLISKLKAVTAALLVVAALGIGGALLSRSAATGERERRDDQPKEPVHVVGFADSGTVNRQDAEAKAKKDKEGVIPVEVVLEEVDLISNTITARATTYVVPPHGSAGGAVFRLGTTDSPHKDKATKFVRIPVMPEANIKGKKLKAGLPAILQLQMMQQGCLVVVGIEELSGIEKVGVDSLDAPGTRGGK